MADGQNQAIDYDALAKQHGAVDSQSTAIDYDALARQQGAVDDPGQIGGYQRLPSPDITTPAGAWQAAKGLGSAGYETLKGIGEMPLEATYNIGRGIQAAGNWIRPGLGERIIPSEGLAAEQVLATPATTAQALGKGAAGIAALAIPGVGEELEVPGIAGQIGRIALNAAQTGLINKLQGGDFTTGAIAGLGGEAIGAGLQRIAPGLAESAMGIGKRERGYGKTPGIAALEETRGFRPTTVEESARGRLDQLNADIDNMATQHPGTIDLRPALGEIDKDIQRATLQNNQTAVNQLREMRSALTTDIGTGNPLAPDQSAYRALNLKRGLRNQYVSNWNPDLMTGTRAVAARASGAIDRELDRALGPEFTTRNQRISSLIPIEEGAESAARNAGIAQNIMHRIGAHTGALTPVVGGALGGIGGYREGGLRGGLIGGGIGLVAPELISSPAARMAMARALYSPVIPRLVTGTGLQLTRPAASGP